MYGAFGGRQSALRELSGDWNYALGAYVGYNASRQSYDNVLIHQNGGTLGVTGMLYNGGFFTGLTVNGGVSFADARTMYGNDDFHILTAGIASKTGYNWKTAGDRLVIQPSVTVSYSYIDSSDYTAASGVKIKGKALKAVQLSPELKVAGNLDDGWQPYASSTELRTLATLA